MIEKALEVGLDRMVSSPFHHSFQTTLTIVPSRCDSLDRMLRVTVAASQFLCYNYTRSWNHVYPQIILIHTIRYSVRFFRVNITLDELILGL